MSLTKIKEANARWLAMGYHAVDDGSSSAADKRVMLDGVSDLLAEIERLRALAREGWAEARSIYEGNDTAIDGRLDDVLKEIDAAPTRPVETIDLRVEGAAELKAASEEIERLTARVKMLEDREEQIGKMLPMRTEGTDIDYRVRGELTRLKILARRGWETAKAMPPIGECGAKGAADFALGQIDLQDEATS